MELSVSGRQRRAAQTAKTTPQTGKKPAQAGNAALRRTGSDRLDWSRQALSFLQEINRQNLEKQRKLLEERQKSKREMDHMTKALKTMDKCREIASRIIKGDKVPPQDEKFLREHDPDGYKLALAVRQPKEKPKEWDTVLEEEDFETGGETEEGTGGEPGESSGGEAVE